MTLPVRCSHVLLLTQELTSVYGCVCVQHHKYLLATCYRHCNQGYRAVQLLKGE